MAVVVAERRGVLRLRLPLQSWLVVHLRTALLQAAVAAMAERHPRVGTAVLPAVVVTVEGATARRLRTTL